MTELTYYADIADTLDHIGLIVREYRRGRRLSLRAAADECGVSATSLIRIESGEQSPTVGAVISLLRWMDGGAS
ncbi:HTH DNA binding domain protein [Gordonia phage BritBrat]|uniref:HTH DNA binding domain protein n=1 Tax=Gordonia phage BritBrat TaxID=1838064 RepID=A0A166XZS0_9CAUD|nr:HTH DNA binding domain protein [Gordonia phage BritBrat]ANA85252.1 HTH DNA binding domain protein [Gordonia phage BritBrat]